MSDANDGPHPEAQIFYEGLWLEMLALIRRLFPLASPPRAFRWWTDRANVPPLAAATPCWTPEECARLVATAGEFAAYLFDLKTGKLPPPSWGIMHKGIPGIDPAVKVGPEPLSDEALANLASQLIYSDDKLRAAIEKAHLPTDDEEHAIRRDNFIQIIKSWLAEHG
jgi:hypothetical protein